jgi:hypothetical protein
MMTARRFQRLWILLFATTLATPACYTLLKHPNIDMSVYEEAPDNGCTSCHTEDDVFAYFHPSGHPVYPLSRIEWMEPPWWWEDYWYIAPSGAGAAPTALRGFTPDGKKDQGNPIVGGPANPPSGPRVMGGDVRVKDPGEQDKGNKDTGEGKDAGDKKKDDRPVRPKSNKGKEDG